MIQITPDRSAEILSDAWNARDKNALAQKEMDMKNKHFDLENNKYALDFAVKMKEFQKVNPIVWQAYDEAKGNQETAKQILKSKYGASDSDLDNIDFSGATAGIMGIKNMGLAIDRESKVTKLTSDKPKEVNVANELDTILGGMFPGYYTDSEVRKKALEYYATPEGSVKIQKAAAEYAKSKTPDIYTAVPTSTGIVPFKARGDKAGEFRPNPEGNPSKPLPDGAEKELGAYSGLRESIIRAKNLFKEDYVGPVAGRFYSIAENWKNLPENQVKFYSFVNDTKDALLRARSGAQINEQEYARLVKFLPTAELPAKNFKARMSRFEEQVDILMKEKTRVYKSQGYDVDSIINAPNSPQPFFEVKVKKAPTQGAKLTDTDMAKNYLKAANGDKGKARKLAKEDGWSF